ncbi:MULTISPECIES: N-acetylglucosamine kinase [unclassified Microbacterium]|uniref:N-acetylglucosamine kinase n=1 Tax=unclassified Microbacterium TaxID=2609290 RepID=UPI0030164120
METDRTSCVAVDLGKTKVRLRGYRTETPLSMTGAGAPGLAHGEGADAAVRSITALIAGWSAGIRASIDTWAVGAAGADVAPSAARRAAEMLRAVVDRPVAITSDMVTAHAGALGGQAGTLLIAGTGAVALRIDVDGSAARSDGWGPVLGDEGSGRWLGEAGLRAALRASDGRGPRTALTDDALLLCDGHLSSLPGMVSGIDSAARMAAFAPRVLDRARDGDPIAHEIVREAVARLATAAASVRPGDGRIVLTGGLGDDLLFREELTTALAAEGLTLHHPLGDALDGAAALAAASDLPHERLVIRV